MDLEYGEPPFLVRLWYGDHPIQPPGSCDCGVEDVLSVGGSDDLHIVKRLEPVYFSKKLHECPVDLALPGGSHLHSFFFKRINLIDEYDRRGLLSRKLEDVQIGRAHV